MKFCSKILGHWLLNYLRINLSNASCKLIDSSLQQIVQFIGDAHVRFVVMLYPFPDLHLIPEFHAVYYVGFVSCLQALCSRYQILEPCVEMEVSMYEWSMCLFGRCGSVLCRSLFTKVQYHRQNSRQMLTSTRTRRSLSTGKGY